MSHLIPVEHDDIPIQAPNGDVMMTRRVITLYDPNSKEFIEVPWDKHKPAQPEKGSDGNNDPKDK